VKVFPASVGGPAYIRSLLGPLGDVPLLATGGVTAENAAAFLAAGAVAVGADSSRALAVFDAVRVGA
jgi:2-dehydro-3-deoxyphosphogluconate aldolase/(4S)-4-hydroxy-2-oxoglutarate aldolase